MYESRLERAPPSWHAPRKGRNDGIRPGAPVVFGDTVVGRVTAVHLTTSEVDLVTSPGFRCTAYLEGDDQNRIVLINGVAANSLGTAKARVSVIPYDYLLPAGTPARVTTTGMGGVFRIAPALTSTTAELDLGLEILDTAIGDVAPKFLA